MKTLKHFIVLLTINLITITAAFAQQANLAVSESKLVVEGTSNIHDWTLEANEMKGTLNYTISDQQLSGIDKLELKVQVTGLKSGKNGLDKNAYKALESDDYADITYTLSKVESIRMQGDNEYKVLTKGYLNIKGSKKQVELSFDIQIKQGKVKIKGSKTLNMTAFGVEPPTALLGTIKTAEEVEILFDVVYK